MSDPTYRIDVRHEPHETVWAWKGTVTRLSDEKVVGSAVSDTRDDLLSELSQLVRKQAIAEPPFSVLVDDDGQPVEAHSVKA